MEGRGELAATARHAATAVNLPFVLDLARSGTSRGAMPDRPEQFGYVVNSHTKESFSVPSPIPTLPNQEWWRHPRGVPA